MSNENQWFYAVNEQRHGAVGADEIHELIKNGTADEIRALIKNGKLNSDSWVWQQGQAEWVALRDCPEFAEILSTVPPKIPPQNAPQAVTQSNDKKNNKTILYIAYACFLCSIILSPLTLILSGTITLIALIALVADDDRQSALHEAHFKYICKHSWIALILAFFGIPLVTSVVKAICNQFFWEFLYNSGILIITLTILILYVIILLFYILPVGIFGLMRLQEDRTPEKKPLRKLLQNLIVIITSEK